MLDAWCEEAPRANLVLSPTSLASGLGMAYLGARGSTAAAMARALRLPRAELASFVAGMRARLASLDSLDRPGVAVLSSDHVWADPALRTAPSYLHNVAAAYRASVAKVPLLTDPQSARADINAAIGRDTRGQITDLLPAGSLHNDGWVLTDATYLNAAWAKPFGSASTAAGSFTTASGHTVRPQFLHATGTYSYARADGWTAVSLPYVGGRLAMIALLPAAHGGGCPVIRPATLNVVISRLAGAPIGLALPKVGLSSKAEMTRLLDGLGMGVAFGPAADFLGLSAKAGSLGVVEHAATLRVDEKGTVAAAATGVGVGVAVATLHRPVVFDRPYLLLVRDMTTGEPLFLARVADPSQG